MMTDFHCHVLPGVDDGSASVEESLQMLRMQTQQGINHVVATPHFYPRYDTPEQFLERRNAAEKLLTDLIFREPELPGLSVGAEVYFFPGISDSEVLQQLTIDRNKCILLEMPQSPWDSSMYRELENIYVKQGITPIIAHIDRYIAPFRTHGIPERLRQLPVMVQANASFFLNRKTSGMALRMLKHDSIHLLGSDCHNMYNRPPRLGQACEVIRRHLGPEVLQRIENYGREILADTVKV